jgi:GAF domain-containing protein
MLDKVMQRGEATWADDLLLPLERHGYAEECYFTFSYSPIRDEAGRVGGVFFPVSEATGRVIGQRRMRTLRDLAATAGSKSKNIEEACTASARVLSANPQDVPFAAIYLFDDKRTGARLAAKASPSPDTEGPEFPGKIDLQAERWQSIAAAAHGEACILELNALQLDRLPQGPWGTTPSQAIAVPMMRPNTAAPVGFLLAGISVRKRLDDEYRSFYSLIAEQLANAIREAETSERERALRHS